MSIVNWKIFYYICQEYFKEKFDATDIISGSKFYEIIIANELNHELIPGQAGTKDAKDEKGE